MREGSITSAARALGISQPAVSQQLARLEGGLSLQLFYRVKGQLEPTHAAKQLAAEAEWALQSLDHFERVAEGLSRQVSDVVRVAASIDFAATILNEAIGRFSRTNAGVKLIVQAANPVEVTQIIASRQADIGISRWSVEQTGCDIRATSHSLVVCMTRADSAVAALPSVEPGDLKDEPMIIVCRRRETRARIEQVFRERGTRLNIKAETHSVGVAMGLVANGLGHLLCDSMYARFYGNRLGTSLVARPFRPDMPRELTILASPRVELSGIGEILIQNIIGVLKENNCQITLSPPR